MGEEKRKTATAEDATENPQKSPRLDVSDAADALLELGDSPSTGGAEATTNGSTYDIGSCEHLYRDREEIDEIVVTLKGADKPPTCEHDQCRRTTYRGAAGMMVCTECSSTFCIGEESDRDNLWGHARWHAARDQHWVAMWCDEPSKGYCFECRCVLMFGQNKVYEDDYAVVARNKKDEWGTAASDSKDDSAMLARDGKVEWGTAASDSKDDSAMLARNGKVDWAVLGSNAMGPWGMVGSTAMDPWGMVGTAAMDPWGMVGTPAMDLLGMVGSNAMDHCGMVAGDDHVIKGIPNLGNTCYMNALLQCLLALGNLRTMILQPNALLGDIGLHLKQLFVETSSANNARHTLEPQMIYGSMMSLYSNRFEAGNMEDSHEFLTSLCAALDNEVEQLSKVTKQGDFPKFTNSIFSGKMIQTISCKSCSRYSVKHDPYDDLQLAVPSKDHPARSKPLQVDSTEVKDTVHSRLQTQKNDVPRGIIDEQIEALNFIPKLCDDIEGMEESTADSHNPEEKEKAQSSDIVHDEAEHMNSLASIEDCLALFSHDLIDCENCFKIAAKLPETNGTKNVEPIIASSNVNTTVDGDQTGLPDRKSCPSERSSDFSSLSVESPSQQPYRSDSQHQVILSEDITSEEVTSGKSCGEKDLASCSTANEKVESHEDVQDAAPSCLTTDKQTDLPSAQNIQDTGTKKQGSGKQVKYDRSAQQVAEKQNRQTDSNGGAIQTQLITKLPPVLTIQLKKFAPDLTKLCGHVSFKEILHVEPFMDPRSEDKDKSSYRLVGVVAHLGVDVNTGHYIAYVRASRKLQGSGPSSWVCANDSIIRRVSLEEVLRSEAYILFYERTDD